MIKYSKNFDVEIGAGAMLIEIQYYPRWDIKTDKV